MKDNNTHIELCLTHSCDTVTIKLKEGDTIKYDETISSDEFINLYGDKTPIELKTHLITLIK